MLSLMMKRVFLHPTVGQPLRAVGQSRIKSLAFSVIRVSSTRTIATQYKRIRLINNEDFERVYPLIIAYIKNPTLALSVEEFFTDDQAWRYPMSSPPRMDRLHTTDQAIPYSAITDDDHQSILSYARSLGLGTSTTQEMLDGLDWWRSQIQSQIQRQPSTTEGEDKPGSDADDLWERLFHQYVSTSAALLLSLCPKIKTFCIGDREPTGPLSEYLLQSNYGLSARPALQELQQLRHHGFEAPGYDDRMYFGVEFFEIFRHFHRLPQITSISMDSVCDYQPEREIFPPRTSPSLKKLHLGSSDISPEMLATMVRIPVALEELSLSYGDLWYCDGGDPSIDLALLGKSLRQHKDTLRALDLNLGSALADPVRKCDQVDFTEDEYHWLYDRYFRMDESTSEGPLYPRDIIDNQSYDGKIGSFHDYKALTRLSISIRAILGEFKFMTTTLHPPPAFRLIDMLPPNLEYLRLYGYKKGHSPDMDSHVREVLDKMGEQLPKLKEVDGVDTCVESVRPSYGTDYGSVWDQDSGRLGWLTV